MAAPRSIAYHVVGDGWTAGQPLLSYDRLAELGRAPSWRWTDMTPECYPHGHLVCLFEDLEQARDFQRTYGGRIVEIDLWPEFRCVRNSEGYLAIPHQIAAEAIRLVD